MSVATVQRGRDETGWLYNRTARAGFILLLLGLIVHVYLTLYYNFTQDDAFITFRYAANFLDGHGLVYNIGERVEGYTNFLWLIIMVLGNRIGVDFVILSKVLGVLCGLGTIFILYLAGRKILGSDSLVPGLSCLILGTTYSFAYWTIAGLETAAFTLAVCTSFYLYLNRSYVTVPLLVIATLLRPEGALVTAFILLHEFIKNRKATGFSIVISIVYGLELLPYGIFKLVYFGTILPNPFYAKTAFDFGQIQNGVEYVAMFFWHYLAAGLFVLPVIVKWKKLKPGLRIISVFLAVYILYLLIIGGDVLKVHRFFVPILPLLILTIVAGFGLLTKRTVYILAVSALMLGWGLLVPHKHVAAFHLSERALNLKMNQFADNLLACDHSDFSLAASTIGEVGYRLKGHTVIDMLGLTDSTIARHPYISGRPLITTWKEGKYNSRYVLSRQPDYILFSTESKPSAPAEQDLFLYSKFLNSYRTIGFFFYETLHEVYKRYYQIAGQIESDVDPNFVSNYNSLLTNINIGNLDEAMINVMEAMRYSPNPKYPYLLYHLSGLKSQRGEYRDSYELLESIVNSDTLVYRAYIDLYLTELLSIKNMEKANYYRGKIYSLVPWYLNRIDSLVANQNK